MCCCIPVLRFIFWIDWFLINVSLSLSESRSNVIVGGCAAKAEWIIWKRGRVINSLINCNKGGITHNNMLHEKHSHFFPNCRAEHVFVEGRGITPFYRNHYVISDRLKGLFYYPLCYCSFLLLAFTCIVFSFGSVCLYHRNSSFAMAVWCYLRGITLQEASTLVKYV